MTRLPPKLPDEVKRVIYFQRLGCVASVSRAGTIHVSPKGSLAVWDDRTVVWADISSPRTVRNLRENPSTEIAVVDPFTRKGFLLRGRAKVYRGGPEFQRALDLYRSAHHDVDRIRSVVLVRVSRVAAAVSPVYSKGLTEDEVRALWEEWYNIAKGRPKVVVDLVPPGDF